MPKLKVMLLETPLDKRLTSQRSQIEFTRNLLSGWGGGFPGSSPGTVDFMARQIHSKKDLKFFLEQAQKGRYDILHIVGHGWKNHTSAGINFAMPDEDVDLSKAPGRRLFEELGVGAIIFSCCYLGGSNDIPEDMLRVSGSEAILSYKYAVDDRTAFLVDTLFYHLYLSSRELYQRTIPKDYWPDFKDHFETAVDSLMWAMGKKRSPVRLILASEEIHDPPHR